MRGLARRGYSGSFPGAVCFHVPTAGRGNERTRGHHLRDGNAALWCLLLPLVWSCGDKAPVDTGPGEDTSPPIYDPEDVLTFEGSLSYTSVRDGARICDVQVALEGTEYVGECDECEFAFVMTGTVTEDKSYDGCDLEALYSWVPEQEGYDLLLGYASNWTSGATTYEDLFMTGFSASYDFGTFGPYWEYLVHAGSDSDSVSVEEDQLSWAFERSMVEVESYTYLNECEDLTWSETGAPFSGDTEEAQRVACDGSTVDVWEVDLTDGEELAVTLDMVSEDTAFDAWFFINDPEGCTVLAADDNYECSYAPIAYGCPSAIVAAEAGAYQVVVQSLGQCTGKHAGYQFRFQQDSDPRPRLLINDAPYAVTADILVNVEGSGVVTVVEK